MKYNLTTLYFILFFTLSANLHAQSRYELKTNREISLISAGIGTSLTGLWLMNNLKPLTPEEINNLSKHDVNRFDRIAISNWSPKADKLSDIMQLSNLFLPATLLLSSRIRDDFWDFGLLYTESMLLNAGLVSIVKSTTKRIRPYVYNPEIPMEEKLSTFARRSFYSGHTTTAFTSAVFFAKVYSDYFPNSDYKNIIWAGTLTEAAVVGFLRFKAGKHFPTDIITGAIVGGLIGYLIPEIHKKDNQSPDPFTQDSVFKISFSLSL